MYEGIECNLERLFLLPSIFDYVRSAQAYHKTLTVEGLNWLFTSCNWSGKVTRTEVDKA